VVELLNIDCMDYMKTCKDNEFDLLLSDPPYFDGPDKLGYYGASVSSVGVSREGYEPIGCWDVPGESFFAEAKRISKNQIIFGINYFDIKNIGHGRIVWDKCNGKSSFSDCEIAYSSFHYSVRMFKYMWNGMMQGAGVLDGERMQGNKKLNEKRIHPTQKPVKLYEWLLNTYALSGQKIIDTHLGSGSSAIAAHYFGCEFVGCEKTRYYHKAATKRYNNETRQMALLET